MPQTIVSADIFQYLTIKGVQTEPQFFAGYQSDNGVKCSGIYLTGMPAGDTYAGLEGSPAHAPWWRFSAGLDIGDSWTYGIDHLIRGGCSLNEVCMGAEVDTGTLECILKLQSTPATGTSDAFTDLGADTQTIGNSSRHDVHFQPGGVVHGALNAGGHFRYQIYVEITGKTGNPTQWGIYGLPFLWSSTDVWALLGSATL